MVVCVVDRDTLCVKTNDVRCATIRLFGVDCPEGKQEFGDKAKEFVQNKVRQEIIRIFPEKRSDKFGRIHHGVENKN